MSKRELIEPHAGDKRYVRRDEQKWSTSADLWQPTVAAPQKRKSLRARATAET
jgi:hypothetical protein